MPEVCDVCELAGCFTCLLRALIHYTGDMGKHGRRPQDPLSSIIQETWETPTGPPLIHYTGDMGRHGRYLQDPISSIIQETWGETWETPTGPPLIHYTGDMGRHGRYLQDPSHPLYRRHGETGETPTGPPLILYTGDMGRHPQDPLSSIIQETWGDMRDTHRTPSHPLYRRHGRHPQDPLSSIIQETWGDMGDTHRTGESLNGWCLTLHVMMMSRHGNDFWITVPLWGESTNDFCTPLTKGL